MLVISSCTCHKEEIKPVKPIQIQDKYLSCKELKSQLIDAAFKKEMYQKRAESPEMYSGSISCLPSTSMQLSRSASAAEDREKYLTILYNNKGCNMPQNILPTSQTKKDK